MFGMDSMLHILGLIATGATLLVNILALWKGAGAERHASITVFISIPIQLGLIWMLKRGGVPAALIPVYTDIALSLAIGVSFLWAALRFQSGWLGVAFMLQGVELAISAYVLGIDFHAHRKLYFLALNAISISTAIVIACATLASMWVQRRRALTDFERRGAGLSTVADLMAVASEWGLASFRPRRSRA
jgi:hypothetical protein